MLEFIIGRAGSGKSWYCLEAIRRELKVSPAGNALFLILPEHMTFKAERELAASEGLGGFSRAYVFGFRRLARQVLLETGGAAYPRITEVGKRLLLSRVLARCSPAFRSLGRAAKQRNFAASLTVIIEEFKSYGVTPAALATAAAAMDASDLGGKLADLSAVYSGLSEEMQGRYNDGEDMLNALAVKIPGCELLADAEIWIDGFVFFNPQELAVIRALLERGCHMHVTLCTNDPLAGENSRETSLFYRQGQTYMKLKRMADELGLETSIRTLSGQPRFQVPALAHVERQLFQLPLRRCPADSGLRIIEAANRRLEIEAVAADILRLCRDSACRWRDIGVLVREEASYVNVFEAVFREYGIPFFSDSKRKSVHHPLAELLRSALEALHGWNYEPLFRCFKTDFFPVTRPQIDRLENYVLAFGLRGKRWTMSEDWAYCKRRSLDEEQPGEDEQQVLAEINHIRRQVMAPLLSLAQAMRQAACVREQTEALYHFLLALDVPGTLQKWMEMAEKNGELAQAREDEQIWEDVMDLFDQIAETSGDEQLSRENYEAVLNDGLDGLQISLIPPGLDYVTLASFDQNSLDNCKALYIVGVSEGVMPRRARAEGLLSDAERQKLSAAGLELAKGASGDNFAENYLLYHAFTLPREYLCLSYPMAAADGSGLGPSPLIRRLREMLPELRFISLPLEDFSGGEERFVGALRPTLSKLAAALRIYRETGRISPFWQDVYNWAGKADGGAKDLLRRIAEGLFASNREDRLPPELARQLYAKKGRLRGSVTRFERFRACPFQHFAQYGLLLKERDEYRFAAPDLGTLLHAALKTFGEMMQQQGRSWADVGQEERQVLCARIVGELAPKLQNEILLSSAQYQHLLGRIERTVERALRRLSAFAGASEFSPARLEQSFGPGEHSLPPLRYDLPDGCQLEIVGQIDRIDQDAAGRHFLIIDYKSGTTYLNMLDLYYGLQLQLMTYLLVAQNAAAGLFGQQSLPAGVLYYFLKTPLITKKYPLSAGEAEAEIDRVLKMPGWVVADAELIRQIDSTAKFLKVLLKSDGTIHGATRSQVKTEEEFAAMLAHIDRVLAETGGSILGGEIGIRPYRFDDQRQACTYCRYRSVCQFDQQLPGAGYRQLEKIGEEEALQNILGEVGSCPGPKHK